MNTKLIVTAIVSMLIGCFLGAIATREFMARMMLHGLYLSSSAQANSYLALLKIQSTGDQAKLTQTLENLLNLNLITLDGCANDLCQHQKISEVETTLNKARGYEFKYVKLQQLQATGLPKQ